MSQNFPQLNQEQEQAVSHDQGPLLIVAGAGTGKTTVITSRIAQLIISGRCRPEQILALTFTDKAAGEMEERIDRLLPYGYVDLWISTFHAFAERILHQHGLESGLPDDVQLLNTTQQWLLIRQNLDKFPLDYYRPLGNPTKFIHALIRHFSRAKDENIAAEDYLAYIEELKMNTDSAEFIRTVLPEDQSIELAKNDWQEILAQTIKKQQEVAEAYHVYQQLLLDNNALDFGDLINYCLKLFRDRKNVLTKYRQQFKYILVDEFQDTNFAQYELIKLLAAPGNNITVVGDDDQSIYKFRGASISNILQFKNDYPAAKEIFLNQNYRSCQNILDLSYQFIQQNNPYRLEVKLAAGNQGLSKKLSTNQAAAGEIAHLHGRRLADEVSLVINKIIELYNVQEDKKWSDFAILVRANSSADDFAYGLEKAGVPYLFFASKGLYSKAVVLDILAFFKLLDNYHESPALYRFLSLSIWGIAHQDIVELNYWSNRKGWSLYESCRQISVLSGLSQDLRDKIEQPLSFLAKHGSMAKAGKNTTEIIQSFLHESGYLKNLTDQESRDNREQLNYLNQFYKKIQDFEKNNDNKTLQNFMEFMELELESGDEGGLSQNWEEEGPDSIKIMTIHSAKGLEFKYVFIPNLVDKRFPTIARGESIDLPARLIKEIMPEGDVHLQEERRLLYVAMTRAKHGLYFSSADDYGGVRKKKISRFLSELSEIGLSLAVQAEKKQPAIIPDQKKKLLSGDSSPVYLLPTKFSFTQLRAFENCPYQYKFAHLLKIPVRGTRQFSFGRSMHLTLQKFFQEVNRRKSSRQPDLFGGENKQQEVSWTELKEIYQQSFIDDWYPDRKNKEQTYQKGEASLKVFYQKYQESRPVVRYLEYPFNLRIGEGGQYIIKGMIDRIDDFHGQIRIVDYKTGNPKDKLSWEDKEQLLIYQLAAQEVMKEEVGELVFYYLDNNSEVSFLGRDKELDKVKTKIISIIEEIKKGDFPPQPGQLCRYCDFKNICEFRSV